MSRSPTLLPTPVATYAAERYVSGQATPRELVEELESKFAVTVTPAQLRQWLSRRGLCERKKQFDAEVSTVMSSSTTRALAKAASSEPAAKLAEWANRTATVADKALNMADRSTKPRDLASAVAAASAAIRTFRVCSGIEDSLASRVTFNYNFATTLVPAKADIVTP